MAPWLVIGLKHEEIFWEVVETWKSHPAWIHTSDLYLVRSVVMGTMLHFPMTHFPYQLNGGDDVSISASHFSSMGSTAHKPG